MRSTPAYFTAAIFLLLLGTTVVCAQQSVDDSRIEQLRSTVQRLGGLANDSNIPIETRENLNELLFEKRGELHALLRQKRDALRARLRGNTSAGESNNIHQAIQQLSQEMQQLKGNATTTPRSETPVELQSGSQNDGGQREASAASTPNSAPPPSPPISTSVPTVGSAAPPVPATQPPDAAQPAPDACDNLPSGPVAPDVEYQRQITAAACRIFRARQGRGNRGDVQLNFQQYNVVMALAIARAKLPKVAIPVLTAQASDASHAKNLSSGDTGAGTTSLVSKAGVPAILGFAAENGGLTRTTSGTTITFTGNPVGLIQSMAKKGFIDSFQEQDDFTGLLRKFSFGLSFDTSRGDGPGTFTGDKQQLSGFSFKYNILDQRDPRQKRYTNRWLEITNGQAANLALSLNRFVDDIANQRMPGINAWMVTANNALTGITDLNAIQTALAAELEKLGALELTADQKEIINQVGTDFDAFIEKRNDILSEIANGWIVTMDYNNQRPVGGPSLSNIRFLAEKGAYNGSIDFTGNASLTFFNSRPTGPNIERLRDFRFAGQLDVPIGDVSRTGIFLISLGGRYQRLLEDEPIAGTATVIPKGDIAAFQAKLTIPIRGTAFKIPLSLSYANRTELLKEREIRGNFGFTFDLDSILARFNPFTRK